MRETCRRFAALRTVWVLTLATLFAGCAHSVEVPLGSLDLARKGASSGRAVTIPEGVAMSLAIVLPNSNGNATKFGDHPNWPLVLRVSVADAKSRLSIVSSTFTSKEMEYANWNLPTTTVLVYDTSWQQLREGQNCVITVEVLNEDKSAGVAKLIVFWLINQDSL